MALEALVVLHRQHRVAWRKDVAKLTLASRTMKETKMNVCGSTNRWYMLSVAGLVLAICGGCSKQVPSSPRSEILANVLATVGDENITSEQFAAEMVCRRTANSPKAKRALLDDLIRLRVLAQEARRRGYDHDPQVVAAYNALLASRLRADVHNQAKPNAREIEAYYHNHPAEFNTPAAVRTAVIFAAAASQMPAEVRAQRRAAIDAARQKALALPPGTFGFGMLSAQYSEDLETKSRGGDMVYLVEGNAGPRWDKPVLEAAFALPNEGALSEVLTTDRGYYLLKLITRRTASVRSLEVARPQIERTLTEEKERQLTAELTKQFSARDSVKIYEDRLPAVSAPKLFAGGTR